MAFVRASFASLIAAVLLAAGLFIVTSFADARVRDLLALLDLARAPFSVVCFLAAWIAIVIGAFGVLAAFLAFIAPEVDENEPRLRRRGFPKAAPIVLIALSLATAWFAIRCTHAPLADPPIAVPIEPATVSDETAPRGDEKRVDEPTTPEDAPLPAPKVDAAAYEWTYMYPLPRDAGAVWSAAALPFDANSTDAERLLCDKAWVAVTGSSSEEGPADRNRTRSRLRTERTMAGAAKWLAAHPNCGETPVFGIDLGQHVVAIAANASDPAASAYQRQVLVVSRSRSASGDVIDARMAREELEAFLADPSNMAALLAGRQYSAAPQIVEN